MVGGNWTSQHYLGKTATTYSSSGTYTLGNADGTGTPLFVGGCEVWASAAPALSPRIAEPTPSSAEGALLGTQALPRRPL